MVKRYEIISQVLGCSFEFWVLTSRCRVEGKRLGFSVWVIGFRVKGQCFGV